MSVVQFLNLCWLKFFFLSWETFELLDMSFLAVMSCCTHGFISFATFVMPVDVSTCHSMRTVSTAEI